MFSEVGFFYLVYKISSKVPLKRLIAPNFFKCLKSHMISGTRSLEHFGFTFEIKSNKVRTQEMFSELGFGIKYLPLYVSVL